MSGTEFAAWVAIAVVAAAVVAAARGAWARQWTASLTAARRRRQERRTTRRHARPFAEGVERAEAFGATMPTAIDHDGDYVTVTYHPGGQQRHFVRDHALYERMLRWGQLPPRATFPGPGSAGSGAVVRSGLGQGARGVGQHVDVAGPVEHPRPSPPARAAGSLRGRPDVLALGGGHALMSALLPAGVSLIALAFCARLNSTDGQTDKVLAWNLPAASIYPFSVQGSFGHRGTYLGVDLLAGGAEFCWDPFEAYASGLVTNPNG